MEQENWCKEYRCPTDGKLLFKGLLTEGEIEIKCKECKELVKIKEGKLDAVLCFVPNCQNRVNRS